MTPNDDRRPARHARPAVAGSARTAGLRAGAGLMLATLLASCQNAPAPLNPDEQVVRTVLVLLASTKRQVCTDDQTAENALGIYRGMALAPRQSRTDLRWFPPTPLRPDGRVTTADLRGAELEHDPILIREPASRLDALPGPTQRELDGAARRMMRSIGTAEREVPIRSAWTPPGVVARWWPMNRLLGSCWPLFSLSNPVRDRDRAFVMVRAEHWGTLYALQEKAGRWTVVAEWSRWLY